MTVDYMTRALELARQAEAEGEVPVSHFEGAEVNAGDEVDVLIEEVDEIDGRIMLSKRKADRIKGWEKVVETHNEGDVVTGRVMRKIKGGLLVDIGVPSVHRPADDRRPVALRRPALPERARAEEALERCGGL